MATQHSLDRPVQRFPLVDHVPKLLLTPAEAAQALSIDRSTLYAYLMSGEIASITIGRARRIPVSALEQWIHSKIDPPTSPPVPPRGRRKVVRRADP